VPISSRSLVSLPSKTRTTGGLSARSSKPENMHVFIPSNHCVRVRNDFTNSSPTQDTVLEAEEQAIIDALKSPSFSVKRDFRKLLSTVTLSTAKHMQREEVEAMKKKIVEDAKLARREKAKKKKKKTNGGDGENENVKAAQTISMAMTIMPTLCNHINRSICKHESNGKYSIALADLGSSVPTTQKWSTKRINTFMGYLNPNSAGIFHQFFK